MLIVLGKRQSVTLPPQREKSLGGVVALLAAWILDSVWKESHLHRRWIHTIPSPRCILLWIFKKPFPFLSLLPTSQWSFLFHTQRPLCFWAQVIVEPCLPRRKVCVPLIIDAKMLFVYCLPFIGAMGEYEPKIEVNFPDTVPAAKGSTVKLECFALGK